ncbi:MAG TPA: hypothetical protein VHB21_20730, partial [Minicystis sp.]|nr:hypothetical protein [Minicystis sp.]
VAAGVGGGGQGGGGAGGQGGAIELGGAGGTGGTGGVAGGTEAFAGGTPEGVAGAGGEGGGGGEGPGLEVMVWAGRGASSLSDHWGGSVQNFGQLDPSRRCYQTRVGPCRVHDCRASRYPGQRVSAPSLGTVTFASRDSRDVRVPSRDGTYFTSERFGFGWRAGDVIHFAATGADLPPFALALPLLPVVAVVEPDFENLTDWSATIDRSVPFEVAWSPTDATVAVEIMQTPWAGRPPELFDAWCEFDGEAGRGEVPADVVGELDGDPRHALRTALAVHHAACVSGPYGGVTLEACTGQYVQLDVTVP